MVRVTKTSAVKRRDIREIPKNSDEAYYRFEIKEWKELTSHWLQKKSGFPILYKYVLVAALSRCARSSYQFRGRISPVH